MSRSIEERVEAVNMRMCSCGLSITPSAKVIAWGVKHGKDLASWPVKCAVCILDATIDLFNEVDPPTVVKPAELPTPICASCRGPLGPKFYQAVPGHG